MITTKVSLQLVDQTVPAIIPVVQGDTGRSIIFEPSDFTIPEGATATYYIQKPSGEAVYNSAEITGNTVVCNLTAQSIIETGENNMQVRIILGEDIVTSFDAILMVRPFRGIGAVESETEINIFDKAVEQAEQEISDKADEIIAEKVPEIEALVEEVIESIPEDYTQLSNDVDDLKADLSALDKPVQLVDKNVFFTNMKYLETAGTIQNASNSARTLTWIPTTAQKILVAENQSGLTSIELLAWDSEGTYVGTWNNTTKAFAKEAAFSSEVDLGYVAKTYPTYTFKLNAKIVSSTIASAETSKYVLWEYDKDKYVDDEIGDVADAFLFDNSTINVIDGYAISGSNGGMSAASNCVAAEIDISNRVGNIVSFNCCIISNPNGFSVLDSGHNWIDGMWGNKSDRAVKGFLSDNCPQRIVWTVPDNACYIRVFLRKEWYESPSDFGFLFYETKKGNKSERLYYNRNFITIAHKGCYGSVNAKENSLQAFINAAEDGYRGIEIDCRKTADGVYVASHNDSVTLYSNGTSASYTISTSQWSNLKGKTLDSEGNNPICPISRVFSALRSYNIDYYVIDLKTGTNEDMLKIANRCGVVDQIMLSYYSITSLAAEVDLLKKYPTVSVRFVPSTSSGYEAIRTAIPNQLFTDVNMTDGGRMTYIPRSLAFGVPILASGVHYDEGKAITGAICAGGMADLTEQITPKQFINMISLGFAEFSTLSTETESVSISAGANADVVVTADVNKPEHWAFGYSSDLSVCNVTQTAFGASATLRVSGVAAGTANLIVFSASGEQLTIPVTVS